MCIVVHCNCCHCVHHTVLFTKDANASIVEIRPHGHCVIACGSAGLFLGMTCHVFGIVGITIPEVKTSKLSEQIDKQVQ